METKIGEAKSQKDQMGNMKVESDLQIQKLKWNLKLKSIV